MALQMEKGASIAGRALHRMPGYGYFLYFIQTVFGSESALGLKLAQHSLGVIINFSVMLSAYFLSRRIFLSLAAGLASMFWIQFVAFQNYVMSETLYTFFISLTVLTYVWGMTDLKKYWRFFASFLFCAFASWTRPIGGMLWIPLLGLWFVALFAEEIKNCHVTFWSRPLLSLKSLFISKKIYPLLGAFLIYQLLMLPITLEMYSKSGKVAGAGAGISMWLRIHYSAKLEDAEDPKFKAFLEGFNQWRKANPEKNYKEEDWRIGTVTFYYLRDTGIVKSETEASDWLMKGCLKAVKRNPSKYINSILRDIPALMTYYDNGSFYVKDAANSRRKWAIDLDSRANKYYLGLKNWESGKYYDIKSNYTWLPAKRLYLKICDIYNSLTSSGKIRMRLWALIVFGFFCSIWMFRFWGWLAVSGVVAYHVLVSLILQPVIPRYAYPVHGFYLLFPVAGIFFVILLAKGIIRRLNNLKENKIYDKDSAERIEDTDLFWAPAVSCKNILIFFLIVCFIKTIGLFAAEGILIDEISVNMNAILKQHDKYLITLHPHAGLLIPIALLIKLLPLPMTYSSCLFIIVILTSLSGPFAIYFINRWTKLASLAWLSGIAVAFSVPVLFLSYMLYGSGPSAILVFLGGLFTIMVIGSNDGVFSWREVVCCALAGAMCGVAYTQHECSFVMTCSICGVSAIFLIYRNIVDISKVNFWRTIGIGGVWGGFFFLPMTFLNFAVPIAYCLMGKDYKELVKKHALDFGFSHQGYTYFDSIIHGWQYIGKLKTSYNPFAVMELIWIIAEPSIIILAFLGTLFCIKEKRLHSLLFFPAFLVLWVIGAGRSPLVVLRLTAATYPFLSVMAACGLYSLFFYVNKCIFPRFQWRVLGSLIAMFFVFVIFIYPALNLISMRHSGYGELRRFVIKENSKGRSFDVSRLLANNHMTAYCILGNKITVPKSFEEIKKNYDYILFEPYNKDSRSIALSRYKNLLLNSTPYAVIQNPVIANKYYPAENGGLYSIKEIEKLSLPRIRSDCMYIYRIADYKDEKSSGNEEIK
jgi:hypothetical protein